MKKEAYAIRKRRKFVYEKEEKKKAGVKELSKFGKYYLKFKFPLVVVCFLLLLSGAISIISPIYAGKMIALFGDNFDQQKIIIYALVILGLSVIMNIVHLFINRIWTFISTNSTYFITKDLTYKLNRISQASLDSAGSGTFTTRMYGDVSVVSSAPLQIADFVTSAFSAVGFVTYLFTMNIWVGVYVFVYLFSTIFLEFHRINTRQKNNKVIRKVSERESSLRNENIRGIKDLRGINASDRVVDKSLEITQEKGEYQLSSSYRMTTIRLATNLVRRVLDFSLIALCVWLVLNKQIEIATFIIVYNFKDRIVGFSNYVVNIKDYFSDCCLSAQRLNEIFDDKKYPREKFGDVDIESFSGTIEFKNVRFGYTAKEEILKGVDLKINPNTITSIVGESGSGKSTIINLITKLYTLKKDSGEILFDGIDINSLTEQSLRGNICTISQNPYIFNMSVEENLKLAKPNATKKELEEVLERVNILDFVNTLPKKLKSKLGENGIKVSGGQKQRLAIARALLTDAKVLLLDEATSALDNLNQKAIKDVVKELSKTHTVIMVAHRLSTVVDSDNIIVIKDGKVYAQGTHDELMGGCEYYKNLYIEEDLKNLS